ncbi:MAG: class I SAM-dependent methyltransferase [Chloroflexi bacterium]|nr:class I SAM-dependent methyltransferase [Chloroflexota bacterium]
MDIRSYNSKAWDNQVDSNNPWTIPVSPETIAAARRGDFRVLLTEQKFVPADWFPALPGLDVLCLAGSGGQQAPILAAAGANVTVLDNAPKQLARDREVAERENLALTLVEGDMADLAMFEDESFDFIFHPVSNLFVPDVRPVWREAYRVLRPGGTLLAGFMNPVFYLFDYDLAEKGEMVVRYALPYSDLENLPKERLQAYVDAGEPLEFGHTLTDQIGGQTEAGFSIVGFYEDRMRDIVISEHTPTYIATRAVKR